MCERKHKLHRLQGKNLQKPYMLFTSYSKVEMQRINAHLPFCRFKVYIKESVNEMAIFM